MQIAQHSDNIPLVQIKTKMVNRLSNLKNIIEQNAKYWDGRAGSYSEVNKWELAGESRSSWKSVLAECLSDHFTGKDLSSIRVLDAGCGPGFFSVIITELGCKVTAVDLSAEMLAEARQNAGDLSEKIDFRRMNVEALEFPASSFDVVISRNLTWNLPNPEAAYAEWCRVLKPGGLLINFDSNWYHYLFDEEKRAGYEADRAKSEELGMDDQNVGENFDLMEGIAYEMPLSRIERPTWDLEILTGLGQKASADTEIWERVWTDQEKVNFASTPMFMVTAIK